ncbi:MAG: hypothetical protein AABX25_00075, partial [Nanoarchaeota archaeon]
MALSKKQVAELREHLDNCKNPLFFFDDDQDGLSAFLLLYRYKREGHGIVVKTSSKLGTVFSNKVKEYNPDKVFILDIAEVAQEFIDAIKVPVVWVDHHGPFQRENVKYFNPRVSEPDDNFPTSFLCYQAVGQGLKSSDAEHHKYLWIAALGSVADWFVPPFIKEFREKYPELLDKDYTHPGDIIFNTKLGKLIRIFSFILKGKHNDVMKSIKILTRIKEPDEILSQETEQGKFIYKRYEQINRLYEPLLKEVLEAAENTKGKIIIYKYNDDRTSFTSDLSNEAVYRFPDKVILIAREKNDEMKCSLRSPSHNLPPLIEKCLVGLEGYGGGHEHACG